MISHSIFPLIHWLFLPFLGNLHIYIISWLATINHYYPIYFGISSTSPSRLRARPPGLARCFPRTRCVPASPPAAPRRRAPGRSVHGRSFHGDRRGWLVYYVPLCFTRGYFISNRYLFWWCETNPHKGKFTTPWIKPSKNRNSHGKYGDLSSTNGDLSSKDVDLTRLGQPNGEHQASTKEQI